MTGTLVDLPIADYPPAHRPTTRPPLRPTLPGSRHEAGLSRRTVWKLLSAWTALWALVHAAGGGYSWHFFALGGRLLPSPAVGRGGLHLYAAHPELQFGPLTLLAAVPLRHLDPWQGRVAATVLLTVMGLVVLAGLVRVREYTDRVHNSLLLLTGLLLLPVWCELATHYAHLDDALALAFTVLALLAFRAGRPAATALLLAAAADSKPWALAFGVLLLALPAAQQRRSAAVFAGAVALAWLPFLLGDPHTLSSLGQFTIHNSASSALRALGVTSSATPGWDRPAQLLLGAAVAHVAVRRGRWAAVPLAVLAARLLLDPETYPYYTAGLLVACAAVDLLTPDRRLPLWSAAAAGFYAVEQLGTVAVSPGTLGAVRALYCLSVLAVLVLPGGQALAVRAGPKPPPSLGRCARVPEPALVRTSARAGPPVNTAGLRCRSGWRRATSRTAAVRQALPAGELARENTVGLNRPRRGRGTRMHPAAVNWLPLPARPAVSGPCPPPRV